jgi:hypothetical protein
MRQPPWTPQSRLGLKDFRHLVQKIHDQPGKHPQKDGNRGEQKQRDAPCEGRDFDGMMFLMG